MTLDDGRKTLDIRHALIAATMWVAVDVAGPRSAYTIIHFRYTMIHYTLTEFITVYHSVSQSVS